MNVVYMDTKMSSSYLVKKIQNRHFRHDLGRHLCPLSPQILTLKTSWSLFSGDDLHCLLKSLGVERDLCDVGCIIFDTPNAIHHDPQMKREVRIREAEQFAIHLI